MTRYNGPRHNFVKKSTPCSPELKKRFYAHYIKAGNVRKTAEVLGLSREMTNRILVGDAISDDAKAKLVAVLDELDKLLVPTV